MRGGAAKGGEGSLERSSGVYEAVMNYVQSCHDVLRGKVFYYFISKDLDFPSL